MRRIDVGALLVAWIPITLLAGVAWAQQSNVGTVNGTVLDSSGAAIAAADVIVMNPATNLTQSTVTTSAGIYVIKLLPVGTYTVSVTKNGFEKAAKTGVEVIAGQTFTVDFELKVGATTQQITVTASSPVVNATDSTQGTTRTLQEIESLPLVLQGSAARAAINLFQVMAGVEYSIQSGGAQSWSIISRSPINGLNPGVTGYEIDGVEASPGEAESGEDFETPVPEQVTEVRLTDNTDASQGFNGRRQHVADHPIRHQPVSRRCFLREPKRRSGGSQLLLRQASRR
jgi:hypothetical protein